MTVDDFTEFITERTTYKPSAKFWVTDVSVGMLRVHFHMIVQNAKTKEPQPLLVVHVDDLPKMKLEMMDEEYVKVYLAKLIERAERHETDEFLKFDGKIYREAHNNG